MLEKLDLTYFRQHEALTVTFTEGLNCIRAPNEGGKTTLLEALGYALFGTPALRNKFEDVVTWGQKPSQLKVVARYDGYTFERSKGGATVYKDTAIVATGQTEVSAFATKLLGCDAKVAGNLMLAGQGGLRGILEAGPTAAANLIEDLGEFDLFDRIIGAALLPDVRYVLIQFHEWHPKAHARRRALRRALAATHDEVWCYPWVWERWERRA